MAARLPAYPARPHSSGQARIKIKGKDYYLGVWGSEASKQEYARLIGQLTAAAPLPHDPREVAVNHVIYRWLEEAEKEREGKKELTEFRRVLTVLARVHGETRVSAFGTVQLKEVRDAMVSGAWMTDEERAHNVKYRKPLGWCRNVANRQTVRIRTVWRWAEEEKGLVPKGSWAHLCSLRAIPKTSRTARQTADVQPATWEQVSAAMRDVPLTVAVLLELQWWSGMRPDEMVRMRVADVCREGPDGTWVYVPGDHDKNSWREGSSEPDPIILGPEAQRVLLPWLEAAKNRGPDAWLFPSAHFRPDQHYTAHAYTVAVARSCKRQGIPHFSPYAIRHATRRRVAKEYGIEAARTILRHKSLGTTMQYARELDTELATKTAKKTG